MTIIQSFIMGSIEAGIMQFTVISPLCRISRNATKMSHNNYKVITRAYIFSKKKPKTDIKNPSNMD